MWTYWKSEPNLYTVGYRHADGIDTDSDWGSRTEASQRVHYLNGGNNEDRLEQIESRIERLSEHTNAELWKQER